jgi:WD40 repeat protein
VALAGSKCAPTGIVALATKAPALATVCRNQAVQLWHTATGRGGDAPVQDPYSSWNAIALSPDGRTIAAGDVDTLDLRQLAAAARQPAKRTKLGVDALAFTSDGSSLMSDGAGKLRYWDGIVPARTRSASLPAASSGEA